MLGKSLVLAALGFLALSTSPIAADLSLATWNIRNLAPPGRTFPDGCCQRGPEDYRRLSLVAEATGADVVAVQEVADLAAFAAVFPPAAYILCLAGEPGGSAPACVDDASGASTEVTVPDAAGTSPEARQKTGFAIRRASGASPLDVRLVPEVGVVLEGGWREHPALELLVERGGRRLALLNVHLAGCYEGEVTAASPRIDCRAMAAQVAPLRAWMDEKHRSGTPFAVLGDFNRRFDIESPDPLANLWPALTGAATPEPGDDIALVRGTFPARLCWPDDPEGAHRFTVDAIVVGAATLDPGSSRRLAFDQVPAIQPLPAIDDGRRTLSDHCPVVARLRF